LLSPIARPELATDGIAVGGSALALFWPGAFAFGPPGVLGPYWQETFGVDRGAVDGADPSDSA